MSDSFSSKRPRVRKMSSPHHSNLLLSGTNSNATSVMLGGGVATSPFSNKRPRNNIKSRGGGGVTVGGGASHKFGRGLIPSSSASSSPVSATVSLRPFEDEEEELLPRHEIILGNNQYFKASPSGYRSSLSFISRLHSPRAAGRGDDRDDHGADGGPPPDRGRRGFRRHRGRLERERLPGSDHHPAPVLLRLHLPPPLHRHPRGHESDAARLRGEFFLSGPLNFFN